MRKILFRGKRVDNSEWVEGDFASPHNIVWTERGFDEALQREEIIVYDEAVDPETVGEFTGLCDKNGKRIFEGDIIEMSFNGGQVELRAQVKYSVTEGYYFLSGIAKDKGWKGNYGYANPLFVFEKILNLEIVGNIHDNPELLEVSE